MRDRFAPLICGAASSGHSVSALAGVPAAHFERATILAQASRGTVAALLGARRRPRRRVAGNFSVSGIRSSTAAKMARVLDLKAGFGQAHVERRSGRAMKRELPMS